MADVRLTATNPEDSSVVPVACNAKGELKLEEIPDQSFDGNLDGDLTVSGSATFAGGVDTSSSSNQGMSIGSAGNITVQRGSGSNVLLQGYNGTGKNVELLADGSATFAGDVSLYVPETGGSKALELVSDLDRVQCGVYLTKTNTNSTRYGQIEFKTQESNTERTALTLKSDGSASFAGGKAGFTAQGHLWCTTRRGDTVILDATSNGLGSWVEYTPPSRREELKDAWAEKNAIRPKPEESSQD